LVENRDRLGRILQSNIGGGAWKTKGGDSLRVEDGSGGESNGLSRGTSNEGRKQGRSGGRTQDGGRFKTMSADPGGRFRGKGGNSPKPAERGSYFRILREVKTAKGQGTEGGPSKKKGLTWGEENRLSRENQWHR